MSGRWLLLFAAIWASPAAAQVPGGEPPGPYVVDLRGTTSGLPTEAPFYPSTGDTVAVPSRALGFEVGAHVYPLRIGPARLGLGAGLVRVRGSSAGAEADLRLLAPQVSFNFGTRNGWSHLSAGFGAARFDTEVIGGARAAAASGTLRAINFGGGARWFLTNHAGVGFDVRVHRVSAGGSGDGRAGTPRVTLLTASVGISLK